MGSFEEMTDLLRDTAFGRLIRLATGRRLLSYPEELSGAESEAVACAGQPTHELSPGSSDSLEKAADSSIVSWYGPNDPGMCLQA